MTATVISSEVVVWGDTTSAPPVYSLTIPSDCTAAYVCSSYYINTSSYELVSLTLNSLSADEQEVLLGTTQSSGNGIYAFYNPATGSQDLDIQFIGTPDEGPASCIVIYVKDGDVAAWRDSDSAHTAGTTPNSVTLTTVSDDLVVKFDTRYHVSTPPGLSGSWTNIATESVGNTCCRASYIVATGSTEVCDSENESESSIVAIAIQPAVTGPVITDVNGTESWTDGDTGLVITGTGFV